jgi:hypothetical protein
MYYSAAAGVREVSMRSRDPKADFLTGFVCLALAGCGGVTADQACSDSAKATCTRLDQCRKNGVVNAYGDLGTCISRMKANCVTALAAADTGNSPAAVEACAMAQPSGTCQDFLQGKPVPACATAQGHRSNGAPCAFNAQCQSAFCAVPRGSLCGSCANLPVAGDPCTDVGNCGPNLDCTPMKVCEPFVAGGGACDGQTLVCAPGQSCVIAAMQAMGTCQPAGKLAGDACDPKRQTAPGCDGTLGLFCASTLKCTAVTYVKAGAACGNMAMNTVDNVCQTGTCVAGMPSSCVALAKEGEACDTMTGPGCMNPGRCVTSGGGTAGTCALPDPTQCMMM